MPDLPPLTCTACKQLRPPTRDGACPLCQFRPPLWMREFGSGYDVPTPVTQLVADGLAQDLSWHNDVCPSFGRSTDGGEVPVRLWVDHPLASEREIPSDARYAVSIHDDHTTRYQGNDLDAALEVYRRELQRVLQEEKADGDRGD